jgi:glutamate carboxypeptidase
VKRAALLLFPLLACACARPGLEPRADAAPALSSEEQAIVRHVDAHAAETLALLQKVVDIESPTEDLAGVRQVGRVFQRELEQLGMTTRWIDMPADMKRAGHLLAQTHATHGTRGQRLLLLGHIDTVLRGERFRREGDKAYGTGISDMKGGVVLMVAALKALHATGALRDARITVLLTGDEESVGRPVEISRRDMVAAAQRSDLVLSFEPTVRDTATVGRRGSSQWTLEVSARTGHSSGIFRESMGDGAIFETARILQGFHEALRGQEYLTFNPSVLVGGTRAKLDGTSGTATGKHNVVPAEASVSGDLRFISEAQKEATRRTMREIVARSLPGTSARIDFRDSYPAMTPKPGNDALLARLDRVSRDLGFGGVEKLDPAERGAGDIAFVAHLLPALDGIGLAHGDNTHAPGEWVDLAPTVKLAQRAAVLMHRLLREDRQPD